MISISTALSIFIIILFFSGLVLHGIFSPKMRHYNSMKERQAERNKIELSHQGGGILYLPPNWDKEKDGKYFNYNLRSWDAGKTWYVIDYDEECGDGWGIIILGNAREMYPGLLEHIEGMDALTKYVEDNGSIGGDDSLGIEALENAGFTVKTE